MLLNVQSCACLLVSCTLSIDLCMHTLHDLEKSEINSIQVCLQVMKEARLEQKGADSFVSIAQYLQVVHGCGERGLILRPQEAFVACSVKSTLTSSESHSRPRNERAHSLGVVPVQGVAPRGRSEGLRDLNFNN